MNTTSFHPVQSTTMDELSVFNSTDSQTLWTNGTSGFDENKSVSLHQIVFVGIEGILAFLICFGNALVMIAFGKCEQLRTTTNYFILHLSVADFSVGFFMPMHMAMYLYPEMLANIHVCIFRYTTLLVTMSASNLCLLAITYDRHTAIFHPLHYEQIMTKTRINLILCGVWVVPLVLALLIPMLWHNPFDEDDNVCDYTSVLKEEYLAYMSVPCFLITSGIIVFMYARIFHLALKISKEMKLIATNPTESSSKFSQEMKLTKTGSIVLGTFFLCWLPFFIITSIQLYANLEESGLFKNMRSSSTFLAILNSAFNPLIYALRMKMFRNEFKKILCIKVNPVHPTGISN